MAEFTAVNHNIKRAPRKIALLGDRRKPEKAQHIIEFPGGAIELSRIADDLYWAHIIINRDYALDCYDGLRGALGEIVDSRIGREGIPDQVVVPIEMHDRIHQIAVLIRAVPTGGARD